MITNERQYRITKAQADKFQAALDQWNEAAPPGVHPRLHRAEREAIESQLADLRDELREYESLRRGRRTTFPIASLDDVPRALIAARIAAGLTQQELAERLGVAKQQVQRDEATAYRSASLGRIAEVLRVLHVQVRPTVARLGAP